MKRLLRNAVLAAFTLLGLALVWVLLAMPLPALQLAVQVEAHLGASGVRHPVTAVLLNFRGYDTLLEVAVLQLALLGVLASRTLARSHRVIPATPQAVLQAMARVLAPLMIIVAGYLLWAGARQPGGAFQASAVAASAAVLLHLAGLMPAWRMPRPWLRGGLILGFAVFLLVASASMQGALLQYPLRAAGLLILIIEAGLTLSLALTLAGLFLWLPRVVADQAP